MNPQVKVVPTCALGEGPHWDVATQSLYYVDLSGKFVHRYVPSTAEHTKARIDLGRVTLIVPVEGQPNKFVVAVERTLQLMEWDGRSTSPTSLTNLFSVEPEYPNNRFNDGKCDSSGRLWAGTMGESGETTGNLYRVDSRIQLVQTEVGISNGIAWNRDNTLMYYIDTPTRKVDVFDFNSEQGTISNRRTLFDFNKTGETGDPDGMSIDNEGNLWVACWQGSQILHLNGTNGQKIKSIALPAKNITSIAFGGPNLDVMFVTSAIDGNSEEEKLLQPAAGCLFEIKNLGVTGQGGGNNFRM